MTEHLAPKDIIHFAVAAAVADSNHDQEWGLIKSGKGEETKRREEKRRNHNLQPVHIFCAALKGEITRRAWAVCCPSSGMF